MQASGVTPRRVFLYTLLAGGLALGGNLFGITSGLLGTVAPGAARDARLDVLFPVKGFKRYSFDRIRVRVGGMVGGGLTVCIEGTQLDKHTTAVKGEIFRGDPRNWKIRISTVSD